MDEVQQIEDAYWELIASEEALRVANKSLETARALREQTKTQFEVGVVSKVEVTEAEAGVSQREVEQIRAENQLSQPAGRADRPRARPESARELHARDPADRSARRFHALRGRRRGRGEPRVRAPPRAGPGRQGDRALRGPARLRAQPAAARARRRLPLRAEPASPASRARPPRAASQPTRRRARSIPRPTPSRATSTTASTTTRTIRQYVAGARVSASRSRTAPRARTRRGASSSSRAPARSKHRLEQQIILDVRQAARNLAGVAGGHRARPAARARPPRSSCAPSRSGSSTANRPRSTCSSARRTSWRASATRSARSAPIAPRSRRSIAPRGRSCATATSTSLTSPPLR